MIENKFIINLQKREDRIKKIKDNGYIKNYEIFQAIDGKKLNLDNNENLIYNNNILLKKNMIDKIKGLKLGEVGCFISHYTVWKKVIKLNKNCLIFEDDVRVVKDFDDKLYSILQNELPKDFDLIWLGIRQSYVQNKFFKERIEPNKNKIINNHFFHHINPHRDTFYPYSYIISPKTCKFLCDKFENDNLKFPQVDHYMSSNLKNNYICIYNFNNPFLASAEQGDTDIQSFNNESNNVYLQKN